MVRVLSGVSLAAAALTLIWFGSTLLLLAVAGAIAALALVEYSQLMQRLGAAVPYALTLVATLAALVLTAFPSTGAALVLVLGLIGMAGIVMFRLAFLDASNEPPGGRTAPAQAVVAATASAAGVLYLGVPLGTLVALHADSGRGAVLVLLATVSVSDTAQFYAGRLIGRRPLAPRLSPKKTVEGAVGGLIAAPLLLYIVQPVFMVRAPAWATVVVGLLLVMAGIAGDLFESTLKRAADQKDSSHLIPGHGGVLDRIDALLFAAPVFYLYTRWLTAA
ncbi:MAG: phosphatidate cytidylyltransferase [Acidobacteriota bacterium]